VASAACKQQEELTVLRRRREDIERVLGDSAAQAAALTGLQGWPRTQATGWRR